jgi:phosphoribosyl-AMP cyclohydrolase
MTDRERDDLSIDDLTYDERGLIPAVVQAHDSREVLMVAWMNRESLARTIETGKTWFWSRSRQKYWMKGESSGSTQDVVSVAYDCDADCLLVEVHQNGSGACHTGERSCFYRTLYVAGAQAAEPSDPEDAADAADVSKEGGFW